MGAVRALACDAMCVSCGRNATGFHGVLTYLAVALAAAAVAMLRHAASTRTRNVTVLVVGTWGSRHTASSTGQNGENHFGAGSLQASEHMCAC